MSFDTLGLCEPLLRAISAAEYTLPTPIQRQAIPPIAAGHDLLGCAQTGTGKTAAFAIPLIQQVHEARCAAATGCEDAYRRRTSVLVLAPTRELAIQINESFRKYGKRTKLKTVVIYGGVSQYSQTSSLARGVDVIVATPGRLLDLMNQGFVDLSYIQSVVLDEADHMLDMGFLPDVAKILGHLPKERQTLLFSATMPTAIQSLAEQNMVNPVRVTIAAEASETPEIRQSVYMLPQGAKPGFLIKYLKSQPKGSALVFTRTKRNADAVVERLLKAGIRAEAIHSNKSQNARQRTLAAFRNGQVDALVATDIAARGIDVRGITYVINYDLPDVVETYTHRIGRTGRAGQPGIAVTLCGVSQKKNLWQLQKHLGFRLAEGERLPEGVAEYAGERKYPADAGESHGQGPSPNRTEKGEEAKSWKKPAAKERGPRESDTARPGAKFKAKFAGTKFSQTKAGKSNFGRPSFGKSSSGKSTFGKPSSGKTAFGKAKVDKPKFAKPKLGGSTSELNSTETGGTHGSSSNGGSPPAWPKPVGASAGKRPFRKKPAQSENQAALPARKPWQKAAPAKGRRKFTQGTDRVAHASTEASAATTAQGEKGSKWKKSGTQGTGRKVRSAAATTAGKARAGKRSLVVQTSQTVKETGEAGAAAKAGRPARVKRAGKKPTWKKSRARRDVLAKK